PVVLPEDGDERHSCLDKPPSQQHRHGVDATTIRGPHSFRLGAQVKRALRLRSGQQSERLLLMLGIIAGGLRSVGQALGVVDRAEELSPTKQAIRADVAVQRQGRDSEVEWAFARAINEDRIVLQTKARGELAGTG